MDAPADTATGHPSPLINVRINSVSRALHASLQALLRTESGQPISSQQIASTYGLNRVFCHRLATALRRVDPLATIHQIPGPEPLRRLVKVARSLRVPARLIRDAESAIDQFEELIRNVAGDRSGLDAIVSNWLPKVRSRIESEAKQAVYRGMRQIKGIAAETVLFTLIMHPSASPGRLDMVMIRGYYGLRCVRPGAQFTLGIKSGASEPRAFPRALDGTPIEQLPRGSILEPFCSDSPIGIDVQKHGLSVIYSLNWGQAVGMESARDVVLAELRQHGFRRWCAADDPRPRTGNTNDIHVPSRLYINDLILHKDAYPDWPMAVRILETGEGGHADANDPTRDSDVLDVLDDIQPLGTDVQRYRVETVPRYVELLEHVLSQVGWNPHEFRGYRTRIEYPVFGSQIQHRFDLPVGPSSPD